MRHPLTLLMLSLAAIGPGCKACAPSLPPPPKNDTSDDSDTDEPEDTEETAPPVDTTPEPPCDVPEVEPNNNPSSPQALPLDQWACGVFEAAYDPESFGFSVSQADWVKIRVNAASIGSAADVAINLVDPTETYSAVAVGSSESSDPELLFPTDGAYDFIVILSESYYGYGEDYDWEMLATITKAPLTWTAVEEESNNQISKANPVASGDVVFGQIDSPTDFDWFSIEIPDAEKHDITVRVKASNYGSPADLRALLYDPDALTSSDPKYRKGASVGDNAYDRDPLLQFSTDKAGTWTLQLFDEIGKGSPAYWYTVTFTVDGEEAVSARTTHGP